MSASIWNPGSTAYAATGNGTVTERFTLTGGQTIINFATFTYTSGANALKLFMDGLLLEVGYDYLETSSSSITLVTAATAGDEVECVGIINLVDILQPTTNNAEVDIAVAATTDIGGASTNFVRIVGSGTINSLGTNFNGPIFLRFSGTVTLTNGAALICPGSTNLVVGAGYTCVATPKATNGLEDGWVISDLNARLFTQSGTGAVARTVQDKARESVSVKDFGAVGDGTTDDTVAIQTAINYCRDNAKTLVFPNGSYRTTATLSTQYDGSYKSINWEFHGGVIVSDFSGSTALNITGGAVPQTIQNITIQPSVAQTMTGLNYDTTSHGITVTNTVVNLSGTVQNFKGYGVNAVTSAANSNTSVFNLTIQTCNFGFYASGTNDNFSVVRANLNIYNCAQSAFYGATGCPLRQWNAWIYAEACCTAVTAVASVFVSKATGGTWWIYSEQQNAANEIDFSNVANVSNYITSARFNKDTYANGNMVFYGGDIRKSNVQTWTPAFAGSTTPGVQTYSAQKGYYIQEGNKVTIWGLMTMTAKDGATAGNLRITGLPINPGSSYTGMAYPISISEMDNLTLTAGKLGMVLQATSGNSYLAFLDVISAGNASNTPVANLAATTTIVFSGTYLV